MKKITLKVLYSTYEEIEVEDDVEINEENIDFEKIFRCLRKQSNINQNQFSQKTIVEIIDDKENTIFKDSLGDYFE